MRSVMLRTLRLSWPVFASGVILLGLLAAGLRLALPLLASQRATVEDWAGRLLHVPVAIEHLGTRWPGLLPHLELRGLRVAPTTDGEAIACKRVEFTLAILDSLRAGEPVLKTVSLEGLRLGLQRSADGRLSVKGIPSTSPVFLAWLLRQKQVEAWNSRIAFEDLAPGGVTETLDNIDLLLRDEHGTLAVRGRANGNSLLGENARFELRHTPSAGGAEATTELRLGLAGTPLGRLAGALRQTPGTALNFEHADGRLWLRWHGAAPARIAADLKLALPAATRTPGFTLLHVRGVASRVPEGWAANLATLAPGPSLESGANHPVAALLADNRLYLEAEALPLDLLVLWPRAGSEAALPALRGELRQFRAGLRRDATPAKLYAAGELAHGGMAEHGPVPALDGLAGRFALNAGGGKVRMAPGTIGLEHSQRLVGRLALQVEHGAFDWSQGAGGWQVQVSGFSGVVQGLPLLVQGTLARDAETGLRLDIEAELGPGELTPLQTLLPVGLLPPHGEQWFREAFDGGRLEGLALALHGRAADFPYDAGNGQFALDFAVSDTTLRYSAHWPVAHGVSGHGSIRGRDFEAVLTAARFADSPADDIHLRLPDLLSHEPRLAAKGRVRTTLADVRTTLAGSPLHDTLGRQLQSFDIDGEFDLLLDLDIGLRHDARRNASGSLVFADNRLASPRETLALDAVSGKVDFTGHQWRGEALSARFEGMPVALAAEGGQAAGLLATLQLDGTAQGSDLGRVMERHVPGVHRWLQAEGKLGAFEGATRWHATLTLPAPAADGSADAGRALKIDSSLEGLAVDLPWPFGKPAAARLPFHLETQFLPTQPHLTRLQIGDGVQLLVQQTAATEGGGLQGLDVALGKGEPGREPAAGIVLHGRASELPLGAWNALFAHGGNPVQALPLAFDLQVDTLLVLGQRFAGVRLRGARSAGRWQASLDGERAAGSLALDTTATQPRLRMDFSRLWLAPLGSDGPPPQVDPRALPTLSLRCASFRYGEIDFGETALESSRVAAGQQLDRVQFRSPAFELTGEGSWLVEGGAQASELSLQLKGPALGEVLGTFGYAAAAIEDGRTRLDIEASWPGMPSEFKLASLTGTLGLHVEEGRLLSVEPGSGRLFGLLSLQELPRRLSLDFADLFAKGFAFDRIEGWFKLEQGNAYTNSLYMEGPSAKVEVSGRTGLLAQDYDQRAYVTPALSASLPIAGALFGPAGVGVGAALYLGQQVFKEVPAQVDRFLRREYTITGSWREPQVEKR